MIYYVLHFFIFLFMKCNYMVTNPYDQLTHETFSFLGDYDGRSSRYALFLGTDKWKLNRIQARNSVQEEL